jgi:hypothetical protein
LGTLLNSPEIALQPHARLVVTALEKFGRTEAIMLGTILIILLILLLIGALPRWGHSASWGYGPSGILGVILVVVLILLILGRI